MKIAPNIYIYILSRKEEGHRSDLQKGGSRYLTSPIGGEVNG